MPLDLSWDSGGVRHGTEGDGVHMREPYNRRGHVDQRMIPRDAHIRSEVMGGVRSVSAPIVGRGLSLRRSRAGDCPATGKQSPRYVSTTRKKPPRTRSANIWPG